MTALTSVSSSSLRVSASSRPAWLRNYQLALVALDAVLLTASVLIALAIRFPDSPGDLRGVSYFAVSAGVGIIWWVSLALTRSYEARFLGEGPEEFRRVLQAAVRVAGALGVACFLGKLPLSRAFVALVLPLGVAALVLGRLTARHVLRRGRASHEWNHRVVVVGASDRVAELVGQLRNRVGAGLTVVGACMPDQRTPVPVGDVGGMADIVTMVARTGADTVAVTTWPGMTPVMLRELAYELEGPGIDLLVAPSLLNIAGSRVSMQPFAGLPLLQLREVQLSGAARVGKAVMDRVVAAVVLLLASPVLLLIALGLRATGAGAVLTSERRIGQAGTVFKQWRLCCRRPLPSDGSVRRREDMPVTGLGRWVRLTYLENVPLLFSVLRGDMSLVGPRPGAVGRRRDDPHDHRRLLVKPGITGLAQTSGRSGQSADEASRLDQQYVDNWSFGLDALLLAKSALMLVQGRRLT